MTYSVPAIFCCLALFLSIVAIVVNGFHIHGTQRRAVCSSGAALQPRFAPHSQIPVTIASIARPSASSPRRKPLLSAVNDSDMDEPCFVPTTAAAASTSLLGRCRNDDYATEAPKDEYALHVGRALDTLRSDYPNILTQNPDFSLYEDDMECIDPALVTLHGLGKYKAAFDVMHAVVKIIYCPARSSLTFRMCYDTARDQIRIHWNAQLQPRDVFFVGTTGRFTHVDGISVYTLNSETGQINQHRIEHLLYNDRPVALPAEGVIGLLRRRQEKEGTAVSIPSFIETTPNAIAEFRGPVWDSRRETPSSLFAMEAEQHSDGEKSSHASMDSIDWNALEAKNKSRLKFGLPPLSPEEFVKLQAAVSQLDATMQEQRDVTAAARRQREEQEQARARGGPSLMDKLFGGAMTDTCESNFDCERPTVCCDFGFVKKCCVSGSRVQDGLQLARIPVYAGSDPSALPPTDKF